MTQWILIYLSVIGTILLVDGLWLGLVAKQFYTNQLGHLMRSDIKAAPAVVFYLLFAAGLVVLAVRPDESIPLTSIAFYGGIVGFIAYGTYNMTNYSTLNRWPIKMTLIDWPWGTGLSSLAAVVGGYTKTLLM